VFRFRFSLCWLLIEGNNCVFYIFRFTLISVRNIESKKNANLDLVHLDEHFSVGVICELGECVLEFGVSK